MWQRIWVPFVPPPPTLFILRLAFSCSASSASSILFFSSLFCFRRIFILEGSEGSCHMGDECCWKGPKRNFWAQKFKSSKSWNTKYERVIQKNSKGKTALYQKIILQENIFHWRWYSLELHTPYHTPSGYFWPITTTNLSIEAICSSFVRAAFTSVPKTVTLIALISC